MFPPEAPGDEQEKPPAIADSPVLLAQDESPFRFDYAYLFATPTEGDQPSLVADLTEGYATTVERAAATQLTVYDTFDWRLFNQSLMLTLAGDKLSVSRLPDGELIRQMSLPEPPTAAIDLPPGKPGDKLTAIIGLRALLPRAAVEVTTNRYRVLNKKDKTVAWVGYETIRPAQQPDARPLTTYLWLEPGKGKPKHIQRLARRGKALGLTRFKSGEIYQAILSHTAHQPGDYSPKPAFKLKPDMQSAEATRHILRATLSVIQRNAPMIHHDLDTEFLHDFRVGIRRTRSVLSRIKGVYPAQITDRFKRDFKIIANQTNALRDLDVYLLSQDHYRSMLPESLQPGIEPVFDYLRQKRAHAFQATLTMLDDPLYRQTIEDWTTFLDTPNANIADAPNAAVPIAELARSRIRKINKQVIKLGEQALADEQEGNLHDLRIASKKLRYLIEFFADLLPSAQVRQLTKRLKKLQNALGEFNDLCVQEAYLLNLAEEMALTGQLSPQPYLAIGALIGALAQRRGSVRSLCRTRFARFAATVDTKAMRALFTP